MAGNVAVGFLLEGDVAIGFLEGGDVGVYGWEKGDVDIYHGGGLSSFLLVVDFVTPLFMGY